MKRDTYVAIVGGGLAGLTAARVLAKVGIPCTVFERAGDVGGRVTTDLVRGFRLDRGFQVFLTAYPEPQSLLDFGTLRLGHFYPGSLIRIGDRFHRIADAARHPVAGLGSLFAPVFELSDIARLTRLRRRAARSLEETVWQEHDITTDQYLRSLGFSRRAIERFFRPFFGGVFLEHRLTTPKSMFDFVFTMFARGFAALPERGMQEIPRQLARPLPPGVVYTGVDVRSVENGVVKLGSGERIEASHLIIATDPLAATDLLPSSPPVSWNGCTTVYYATDTPPLGEAILVLNGIGADDGPVNHLCVPSNLSASYAPPGSVLISATIIGVPPQDDAVLDGEIRQQLTRWFGASVVAWEHLRTYRIPRALPRPRSLTESRVRPPLELGTARAYLCGDYLENPSIDGAMKSGRRTAEALLVEFGVPPQPTQRSGAA